MERYRETSFSQHFSRLKNLQDDDACGTVSHEQQQQQLDGLGLEMHTSAAGLTAQISEQAWVPFKPPAVGKCSTSLLGLFASPLADAKALATAVVEKLAVAALCGILQLSPQFVETYLPMLQELLCASPVHIPLLSGLQLVDAVVAAMDVLNLSTPEQVQLLTPWFAGVSAIQLQELSKTLCVELQHRRGTVEGQRRSE